MGWEESGDRSILNYPCSGMTMFKSQNGVDPFYGSNNWDPIVSLSQSGDFVNEFANPHCENQTVETSSHLVHFPSESSPVNILPKISSIGSSLGHIAESSCHPNLDPNNGVGNTEDGLLGPSPYGKRKRKVSNAEEQQKDPSDDNKQKFEQNISPNSRSKPAVKQAKDNSIGSVPSKENYIHVRAKRGQATNSHSLAERVRRERISERMRLLQELVPGCNKITGKAVMLDEIINYVKSLQQQVLFLSMKLATVNPELDVDIDRILSKDILHLHGINPAALGIASGLSSSHLFPGYPQGTINCALGTTPTFNPSLTQHIWNNELQGILQMGFDPDPSVSSLGPNGLSKMEL